MQDVKFEKMPIFPDTILPLIIYCFICHNNYKYISHYTESNEMDSRGYRQYNGSMRYPGNAIKKSRKNTRNDNTCINKNRSWIKQVEQQQNQALIKSNVGQCSSYLVFNANFILKCHPLLIVVGVVDFSQWVEHFCVSSTLKTFTYLQWWWWKSLQREKIEQRLRFRKCG